MDSHLRERIEALFHAARERQGAERAAYLDGACGEDGELRRQVEELLEAHDQSADFLEEPAVEGPTERPGTCIGPYKLLQEIGEGGMGVVYMAEQTEPVARKVALKVIKLGMDTKQVIARFEAERQALAMMDHPNIARVLDAGATETGRPYFVMELVRGISINEYCDKHKLSTDERLGLFVTVCRAVQHAHQKGVIHRDLKPSNVLVTSHDGLPVPKIIDFGVAKATNRRLTERTLFTEFRQIIGTPEYMSPEQAEMSGLDVDTRSDIYSLGVLLYQLLTGTTPVDATELRTAGFEEMTRIIREEDPPAPSTRISKLGADAEKIARHRGSDAGSLSRHFRGDLDWIVMKALEKDRTRRYETASAFAQDVLRHLENQPVEAGPRGTGYRVRKFVHRNRKAAVAAGALALVIALGLTGTTAGFLRASNEAARNRRVSDSLQDVLAMTDAASASSRAELEAVLKTVRETFGEDHATYAAVLDTLSEQLHDAGDFDTAAELCSEALKVWKSVHGEAHPNVAIALSRLGRLQLLQGREEEAEDSLRRALGMLDGASDVPGQAGYEARAALADMLVNHGEYEEADELFAESLALLRGMPTPPRARILEVLEARFTVQLNLRPEDALKTLREVYDETHRFYPEDSPMLAISALGLGNYLVQRGREGEAEPYLREAIERFRACKTARSYYFLAAHDALLQILRKRDDPEAVRETDELLRDTIELARPIWGPDTLAVNLGYLGERLLERGRYAEAVEAILEAHQALVDAGRPAAQREGLRDGLAKVALQVVMRAGDDLEAQARARKAIEVALADEPEHPGMITVLAGVLYREGHYESVLTTLDRLDAPLSEQTSGLARNFAPADHGFRAMALARLGRQEAAEEQFAALRAQRPPGSGGELGRLLFAEVESVVRKSTPAENGG